jgi:hypothetical protein
MKVHLSWFFIEVITSRIYKFSDWSLIGLVSLIGKAEGRNYTKEYCWSAKVEKAD